MSAIEPCSVNPGLALLQPHTQPRSLSVDGSYHHTMCTKSGVSPVPLLTPPGTGTSERAPFAFSLTIGLMIVSENIVIICKYVVNKLP